MPKEDCRRSPLPKDKGRDDLVGACRGPSCQQAHYICNVATASEALAVAPRETVSSYRTILCMLLQMDRNIPDRECFFQAGRTKQPARPAQGVWNRLQGRFSASLGGPPWLLAGGGLLWEIVGICPPACCPTCRRALPAQLPPPRWWWLWWCCCCWARGRGSLMHVLAWCTAVPQSVTSSILGAAPGLTPIWSLVGQPTSLQKEQHATSASSRHANVGPGPFSSCT